MRRKIAVTGSSGFIGRHLIPELRSAGHDVSEISRKHNLDITNWSALSTLQPCDIIIHLAARTFVPDSFAHPRDFYDVNMRATLHAMELARLWKAKVIYMSSYLYGPPQYLPVDESHPIHPHNPYAQTKLIAEQIVQGYCRDFKINSVMFRLFNLYGPDQDDSFLIPTILAQVKKGKVILKDPRPKRDFIHIDDVIRAIVKAIEVDTQGTLILNLGSGRSHSVGEVVDLFKKHSSKTLDVVYTNEYRQGEVLDSVANIMPITKLLGWQPQITLEKGIQSLLQNKL